MCLVDLLFWRYVTVPSTYMKRNSVKNEVKIQICNANSSRRMSENK